METRNIISGRQQNLEQMTGEIDIGLIILYSKLIPEIPDTLKGDCIKVSNNTFAKSI